MLKNNLLIEPKLKNKRLFKLIWIVHINKVFSNNFFYINFFYKDNFRYDITTLLSLKSPTVYNKYKSLYSFKKTSVSTNFSFNKLVESPITFNSNNTDSLDNSKLYRKFISITSIFTKVSLSAYNNFTVHPYWSNFFIKHSSSVNIISLSKLYRLLIRTYYLLFNLNYYKIPMITFGNPFFSSEVNSLNWLSLDNIRSIWRYIHPFLCLKKSNIFNHGKYIFRRIRYSGINVSVVIDVFSHRKTFFYLNNSNFYTIAVVPTNYTPNIANYSIPTTSDSVFSQLFFVRFLFFVNKESKKYSYKSSKNTWLKFFYNL